MVSVNYDPDIHRNHCVALHCFKIPASVCKTKYLNNRTVFEWRKFALHFSVLNLFYEVGHRMLTVIFIFPVVLS